jgi:dienelactone hydrolase
LVALRWSVPEEGSIMTNRIMRSTLLLCCAIVGAQQSAMFGAVNALFDLSIRARTPFPSDWFTVEDPSHKTGRRVNLPFPDCSQRVSDCEDLRIINLLDGFNVGPRVSIPFDGPIDLRTVTRDSVFITIVERGNGASDDRERLGTIVGLDKVVWDAATNTLYGEADKLLEQHTRYALVVTQGVLDLQGQPVRATGAFREFRQTVRGDYKQALLDAIHAARRAGVRETDIVAASTFTTQSVSPTLEKIREQINRFTAERADFLLGPNRARTVFPLKEVASITLSSQTHAGRPLSAPVRLAHELLNISPGAVETIAFGKFKSPDFQVHPGEYIPSIGTRTGTPAVQRWNDIYFSLFLPSGPKPGRGWPVAIFGHGNTQNKDSSILIASMMAARGIATIAINAAGHGFGPLSELTVNRSGFEPLTFAAGGRGIDQNADGLIEANEGLSAAAPQTIIFVADGIRQTAADLLQLVRVIQTGVDAEGDGSPDLDASRIYYVGFSLGGNYGLVFLAIEPTVRAGILNVPAGPIIENRRLSPGGRPQLGAQLSSRIPPLMNAPGIANLDGVAVAAVQFNENVPLRDHVPLHLRLTDGTIHDLVSPVTNTVAGATAIQELIENTIWVDRTGDPVAYAPYLRMNPLAGVSAKSIIVQFAKADQTAPNPNASAILRAGELASQATYYRHDLAHRDILGLPKNPHVFLISIGSAAFRPISLAAQDQIGTFFQSDGSVVIHPEPARFFEVPIQPPLPEDLNFIP